MPVMYKDHETMQCWLNYSDALRKYLLRRADDKTMVEDILHDVYLKIFCHCKRYDFSCEKAGVKNLRSWMFQVCHNAMVDHHKKSSQYFLLENIEVPTETDQRSAQDDDGKLLMLLNRLPPKYALPVYYHAILEMKQSEIAEKFGLSLPATKSRIQRGKKMLVHHYKSLPEN